jgi:hypothetical protein
MTPDQALKLHQLRHAVLGARDRGRVVIEFTDGPGASVDESSARHLADAMLALANLPVLGPPRRARATNPAPPPKAAVLHEDLETHSARVPQKVALDLVRRVFDAFGDAPVIYLTNVRPNADLSLAPSRWASGRPDSEFDAGVAIVSGELVGVVWVEDRP